MSILNDSVFLLQPTGIKESKIYSTFPTNGDGDFTFSRSSLKNRIAKNGYITKVDQNIPSLSYREISGVSDNCPHIEIEAQSTNLIPYSENFSEWTSVGNAVVTDNFISSPDGTKNAAKVVFDGTTDARIEISVTSTGQITQSIYLKSEAETQDVSIGCVTTDLKVVTLTNQWQRFSHTSASGSTPIVLCSDAATIYVAQAQAENSSFASSYITSNEGAASSRVSEGSLNSNFSSSTTFPANTSTLVLWFSYNGKNGNFYKMLRFQDYSGGNSMRLETYSSNLINVFGDNISGSGLINGGFTLQPGTLCKMAIAYNSTNTYVYINGSNIGLNAPTGTLNIINNIYNINTSMNNVNIHRIAVFNTLRSTDDLVALTS